MNINLGEVGTYIAVFNAGFLSFLSPCLLPLIPAYISVISGLSLEELSSAKKILSGKPLLKIAFFILGFSLVFVFLGASASFLGSLLQKHRLLLAQIAGVFIIVLGLHLVGLVKLSFLEKSSRKKMETPSRLLTSFFLGGAFALGWSPCVGPILGSVLLYAAAKKTVVQGMALLATYSLGLAIPFFLSALFVQFFLSFFKKFKGFLRAVKIVSGFLLLLFGLLLLTNKLTLLSNYFLKVLPSIAR